MINKTIMASDGINRTIEGKIFGKELRVYRVYGDVTDRAALEETAQILAFDFAVDLVTLNL
tara:strand:+ start:2134 stop:2316 length:183 start_codon:yes stop_codon:yes gene_type:complete